MPLEPHGPLYGTGQAELDRPPAPAYRWYHKTGAVLLIVFCFELGVFFVVFPWLPYWDSNFLGGFNETWSRIWRDPYFRGGASGLGLVNIYISVLEMIRLKRFADPVD